MPRRKRILVVDDDPDIAESLSALLAVKLPQADVETEASAEAALRRLESWRPDVILSDFRMPGMDGVEFLTEVKQKHGVPAVLMTAYSEKEAADDAARRGIIRRFYHKPIDVPRLIEGLQELLDAGPASP